MPTRPCRIFDCSVNIEEGFFVTKRISENKGNKNNSGYWLISLPRKGCSVTLTVHKAIFLEANNIEQIPEGFLLHHRDNDTGNNCIENLSLCTQYYNTLQAAQNRDYDAIYTKRKQRGFVQQIEATCGDGVRVIYPSMNKAARALNVNVGTVSKIVNGKKYYNSVVFKNKTWKLCRVKENDKTRF